jgi:thymidylate synthase|nr:MAG TPA: hypothetical protein [Caudoviricetes sp.]
MTVEVKPMCNVKFGIKVEAKDIDSAFLKWVSILKPQDQSEAANESRDGMVAGEVINATTEIVDPTRCIMKNRIRKMPIRYAIGEMLWYIHGSRDLQPIKLYTNGWDRMSDDGLTVNSNYGWCIKRKYGFDQVKSVLELLRDDSSTRQAVINIKEPQEYEGLSSQSKDINCTVCFQFFIRDKKLYMITYMRSNDIWLGFPFDVFQFTNLQVWMAMELGVGVGTYTHIAGSLHLYQRDYEVIQKRELEQDEEHFKDQVYKKFKEGKLVEKGNK